MLFNLKHNNNTVTDIDGNIYNTVKIGDQWWMAENLKVTRFSNGDPIPSISNKSDWKKLSTGAYCIFREPIVFGYLYNWYAIEDSRNIAPEGWHVPTVYDWIELTGYLGENAGAKLKADDYWRTTDTSSTVEIGFRALPGGFRSTVREYDKYNELGSNAYFWNSMEANQSHSYIFNLFYRSPGARLGAFPKVSGISVRCVKDKKVDQLGTNGKKH